MNSFGFHLIIDQPYIVHAIGPVQLSCTIIALIWHSRLDHINLYKLYDMTANNTTLRVLPLLVRNSRAPLA